MSHMFIAVNGDNVGESIGNAIISDNHDELSRVSGAIKSAHQMIDQWVSAQGGKVVVSSGDEGIYMIPQAAANQLDQIRQKYASMANTSLTIGVGSTMSEASKALIYGKMNNKDQIVHYEPAVDDYISNDPEAQAQEQDVEGQLPSEEEIAAQGDEQNEMEEGAAEGGESEFPAEGEEGAEDDSEQSPEEGQEEGSEDEEFTEGEDEELEGDAPVDGKSAPQAAQAAPGQKPASKQAPQAPGQAPAQAQAPQKQAAPAAPGKAPKGAPAPAAQESEEDESAQPAHEEDMDAEEDFAHDAQENQDDEADADNIEADEEDEALGDESQPNEAGTEEDADQDGEFPAEGEEGDDSELDPESSMGDGTEEGDMPAEESEDDEEGMGFGDETSEDDGVQELGEDEVEQDPMDQDEQGGIMSEMMHANMGDEEAEDSDDEIKQDIIECLMQFKANKAQLEEMKQSNPEMYQANIIMLRSMIQMAKKLQMNPERALAEKSFGKDTQDSFPAADDDAEDAEDTEQNPLLMGKSEKPKITIKPHPKEVADVNPKIISDMKRRLKESSKKPTSAKKPVKDMMDDSVHMKGESVMNKARMDEGKSPAQKQVARAYRNDRVKNPETKKIVGNPKQKQVDPKAFTKSKVEEMKIDLKKKPDVKKQ